MQNRSLGITAALLAVAALATAADTAPSESFNPTYESATTADDAEQGEIGPRVRLDLESGTVEERVERVLAEMSLQEKIGQLCQISASGDTVPEGIADDIRRGWVGSLFYTGSATQIREAQRIAQEESRLGLPLLTPRDVIHGFRTVFPIPLGQAASWNPELAGEAAAVAAQEAMTQGVNWTFAPMLDVARDARWGRIAESTGEDPVLGAAFAEAIVRGYQNEGRGIAACAKHYVAYGLSEGGRDYNRAQVATSELHNVFLPSFRAAVDAGCATLMTGFSTINGIPATGHEHLVRGVLKGDWGFDGLVVSDWGSVMEMIMHGYAADKADAAELALRAGVDMEMVTDCFRENVADLIEEGKLSTEHLDDAVRRILRIKFRYAKNTESTYEDLPGPTEKGLEVARRLTRQSMVLLKNDGTLPLDRESLKRVAVIGPLADAGRDQLGCWMLDGKGEETITPLAALRSALDGSAEVGYAAGLTSSIDESRDGIAEAVELAAKSDAVILCVGEGWWLSGEARCRADIDLPGAQSELVSAVAATGKPTILVVLAGRPLTIGEELGAVDAALYAWHPGTTGGPALVDLLMGDFSPSGKLPVSFPQHVGQAPLYYNAPMTGRPAAAGTTALIGSGRADFPEDQKYRSHYLDVAPYPLLPFGFGLSYTEFEYTDLELSTDSIGPGQTLAVRVRLTNTGDRAGEEVAQLYVRDVTARIVRPVRELKAFRRVALQPDESRVLEFSLNADELGYYDNNAVYALEEGEFRVGVGGDGAAPLSHSFRLTAPAIADGGAPAPSTVADKSAGH